MNVRNAATKMMKTPSDWFGFEGHLPVIYAVLGVRCAVNYTHYINTLISKEINQCAKLSMSQYNVRSI